MTEPKQYKTGILKWSIGLLFLAFIAIFSGGIVFIGPLLISLAPNFLLLGFVLFVTFVASLFLRNAAILWLFIALVTPLIALNTRIPTLLKDVVTVGRSNEKSGAKLQAYVSQPIRLRGEEKTISARRFAYDTATPSCYGDGCFITRGFRTPLPHYSRDYWIENPKETILGAGFTLAKPDELTPILDISTEQVGLILTVSLRLSDAAENLISSATYQYRNGFPLEPKDDSLSIDHNDANPKLTLNYLAHGNFINSMIGRAIYREDTNFPIRNFISRNFEINKNTSSSANASRVQLEILEQKIFEPTLLVKGENKESAKDPWPDKGWDAERYKYCDNLLKRESPQAQGGTVQVWWLFAQDTTGRKKIRRTGNELCDEQSLWSFEYVAQRPAVLITKYSALGELQYQTAIDRPSEIYGFHGRIRQKTFREIDGYVYFDWMDTNHPGYDLEIKRNLSVRFLVPKNQSN